MSVQGFGRILTLSSTILLLAASTVVAGPDARDAAADSLRAGFRDPPADARPAIYWLWLNGHVNREHNARELEQLHAAGFRGICLFDMGARGTAEARPPAGPAFLSEQSVGDIADTVRTAGRLGMDVQLSVASSWDMGGPWVDPRHASMGLYTVTMTVDGPAVFDEVLPLPEIPAAAPRGPDGRPVFLQDVAVLALPADTPLPGHDFVFALDPPGIQTLTHAELINTPSDDPATHGPRNLFTKDISIAVSTAGPIDAEFHEVLKVVLEPHTRPQRFDLPPETRARYVRLRILSGHNPEFDRVQLGEFRLFNPDGVNVVASHEAERERDGAELLGYRSALGQDRNWTAANIHDGVASGPSGSWSSAGPPPLRIADPAKVLDLNDRIDADGRLRWEVPAGRWILQRHVCANTGERLKVPSPNSDGLATDHLSAEATRAFLGELIERLRSGLGADLGATALRHLYLASYEVRGPIWTPDLLTQFRRYRGYDMTPYLPALSGHIIGDDAETLRFLEDYRRTLGDLLVDAYYRTAVEVAHQAGLGVESEAGGPGPPIHQVPVDALTALGAIDEVRGEFWPRRPTADRMWVVKETASAAHIYGKKRVHMEAFTGFDHWQDSPFDLKPSADRAFCEGANHFVWHTSAHRPPEAGLPGWVYNAGTHLGPNEVWWPMAPAFLNYLARGSFLLQQGHFVADVCKFYGARGYNFVPPKHVDRPIDFGYDFDVTNAEVLLTRMGVRDGRIILPDGMSYELLVLPDHEDIDLEVLQRIEELVRAGATVVGPRPRRASGLAGYPERDEEIRRLAERLWGDCDGLTVFEHAHGAGRIVWGRTPRAILEERGIGPDFQFTSPRADTALDFIHRRTDDADIYFVHNMKDRPEEVDATFRVEDRVPELWDPATGEITRLYTYASAPGGLVVPLRLAPHGSIFVVFRRPTDQAGPVALRSIEETNDDRDTDEGTSVGTEVIAWDGEKATLWASQPGRLRLTTPDGRSIDLEIGDIPPPIEVDGPWAVRFLDGRGAPEVARFDRLTSWTEHADEGIRYYSGTARYVRDFDLPTDWLAEGRRVRVDLGGLWAAGSVQVNGRPLGVLWKPPYLLDITEAARPGRNTLVVEVVNTWSNRLVGDARAPQGETRHTRTNIPSTGGKPWKDVPLLDSGLFGPVRLVPFREVLATPR